MSYQDWKDAVWSIAEAPLKPETPADKAKEAGLVSTGPGTWAKEKDGPTVAQTVGDKLMKVGDGEGGKEKPEKDKEEPKKKKSKGKVLESIPPQNPKKVQDGYNNPTKKGTVPSARDQIASRIEEIDDPTTKETAQEVQKNMDQFVNAETDREMEEILRWMADNNLIQINTEDPKSKNKKIYFDTTLTGLSRKTLSAGGNATTREMWRILHEKQIAVPFRGSTADRALADMSGKHNESGMVLLLSPEGSPNYEENRKIHEGNKKSYEGLGGDEKGAHQRNVDMANKIKETIPKGSKISDGQNTGGIGSDALAEQFNINNKVDATDLIVFYTPPKPDPNVKIPTIAEYEKQVGKKFKDMTAEEMEEREELIGKRLGGMRKISAKAYSDPTSITVKNSGVRAGSEYLNDPEMDDTLVGITKNPENNYKEPGLSKDEVDDRKKKMKREYMTAMQDKMEEMSKSDDGQKQLLKMWKDAHGCGHDVYTSVSNKKTGESILHDPDHYCTPKQPFSIGRNETSITITLDDNVEDSLQLDLKTEMASSPKLLMRHLAKKGKKEPEEKEAKEQYESLEGIISRMERV